MNTRLILLVSVFALAALSTAQGDVLSLKRGDVLSGQLVDLSAGIAVFDTGLAGQVVVPISQIRSLSTDETYLVEFNAGEQLRGRFVGQGETTRIVNTSGEEGTPIRLGAVKAIAPASEALPTTSNPASPIDFSWETGYLHRWGTQDDDAPYTRFTLRNDVDAYDFFGEGLLELSDEDSFPRWFRASAEWRFPSSSLFLPELGVQAERDLDEALEFRGTFDAGLTRLLLNEPSRSLEITGGLNAAFEYYDAATLWQDQGTSFQRRIQDLYYADEHRREQDQDLNLRFRLRFRQDAALASLAQTFSLYPSLTDFGELRARSESSLRMPVTAQLNFRLHLFLDYDADPEFQRLDRWRTSIGAGFEWDF